jgi:hypothetical protein
MTAMTSCVKLVKLQIHASDRKEYLALPIPNQEMSKIQSSLVLSENEHRPTTTIEFRGRGLDALDGLVRALSVWRVESMALNPRFPVSDQLP